MLTQCFLLLDGAPWTNTLMPYKPTLRLTPYHASIMRNRLWTPVVTNLTSWSVEGCDLLVVRRHVILQRFHHKLCTHEVVFFVCHPLLKDHGNIVHSQVANIQLLLGCVPESTQPVVKHPVLSPCAIDGRSRNPLYYYCKKRSLKESWLLAFWKKQRSKHKR